MPDHDKPLNGSATIAPIANVGLAMSLMQRLTERPDHLPGLGVFYGRSGLGKSRAAAHVANRYRAYYIECKTAWTTKKLLQSILQEMGIVPVQTIYDMVDQICEQLVRSGRGLIIDEMDKIVEKKAVEIIRDVFDGSNAPILMIGEENIPTKLRKWERFHGRVLAWVMAQLATLDDARKLRGLYCKQIRIADDLLERTVSETHGSARYLCVNLESYQEEARVQGWEEVTLARWGQRPIYTGEPPRGVR